jgi:hypothetical protein
MNKKVIALVLALLAVGLLAYWKASDGYLWSQEQVEVKEVDPIFGTESTTWKDEYHPGLLPVIGPAAGALLLLAAGFLWRARRKPEPVIQRT